MSLCRNLGITGQELAKKDIYEDFVGELAEICNEVYIKIKLKIFFYVKFFFDVIFILKEMFYLSRVCE